MPALTVLIAPPGPAEGVGDALADWSAAGLLHPFLWVDGGSAAESGRGNTPALLVHAGRRVGTSLEQTLTQQRFEQVRLVVLVPALAGAAGVPSQVEQQIHQAALATGAASQVQLLRAVLTRPDSGPVAADLVREGWHNIVLAPEQSRGPGLGQSVLPPATDAVSVGADAAAAVAGLTGLWQHLDAAPLDGVPAPFGRTLRLARSFYRSLDASAVADQVRAELLSVADGVPLPRQHGVQAVHIDDAPMAANDMAVSVLRRHASQFRGERVAPAPVEAEKVGAWRALKMLFGFLWASLTMAPMKWYSMVVGDTGGATANRVQQLVFGADPAAYNVVAQGELAAGRADWQDLNRATASLDQALDGGKRTHEIAGDFSAVWSDYVDAGLTLVDAGERSANTPIQVGTERGVLRRMSDCAPGPDEAFRQIPPRVAAAVGISDVRAADPLGQHTLQMRLRGLAAEPSLARDADATLRELETWQQRHRHSYAARTGAMIADTLMSTAEEVRGLAQLVSRGNTGDLSNSRTAARQKQIAAWLRTLFFGWIGLSLLLVVGGFLNFVTWGSVALASGIGLVVWLVGSLVLFLIGQRDLFADLNARRAEVSKAEADQRNLATALRDLHRQTEAYGQFLEWTRVLGVLLHAPFGDAAVQRSGADPITEGLPVGVRIGVTEVDPEATADVVALMRRDLFQSGWLSAPWQATLTDAGQRLGTSAVDISQDPRRLFAQRARVSESWLTKWADELERAGVGTVAGDQLWQFAMQRLSQPDYRSRLVGRVKVAGTGAGAHLTESEFMSGVDGTRPVDPGRFDLGVLAREARLEGRADSVVESWPFARAEGLNRQAVLVQLSEALPDYTFDLGETVVRTPETSGSSVVAPTIDQPGFSAAPSAGYEPTPARPAPTRPSDTTPPPGDGWVF
ncbi:hypothetical protein CGZ93_16180 [Enemella dayhoffiae]|uniref:Uncharacterized protein n=1 Tax=Enemella dayhoffiae TaxID=2016507 RepID=A0A255GRQ5_9ACTN|nr:hypothetical protein [Enemella dayhoffiae]OYO18092.1 hypothetical protein CGZ93_16180 [Enemella dayhoffiae]